jgi:hypothetical protein
MAEILETTPEFLLNPHKSLILTSEERFIFKSDSPEPAVNAALSLLADARALFSESNEPSPSSVLTDSDKQMVFSCLSEIYFGRHDGC